MKEYDACAVPLMLTDLRDPELEGALRRADSQASYSTHRQHRDVVSRADFCCFVVEISAVSLDE